MVHFFRRFLFSVLIASFASSAGCGDKGDNGRPPNTDPVEYFLETQGNTVTPDGRIVKSTVEQIDKETIRYKTENGSIFDVKFSEEESDSSFRYYEASKVPPSSIGESLQEDR